MRDLLDWPYLWPAPRASYVALCVLLAPRELTARRSLRLEAPAHPTVVFEVRGQRSLGPEVLVSEGDPRGTRKPRALIVLDLGSQLVFPLRMWLCGRRINLVREAAITDEPTACRMREDAQDLLVSYLTFLVVWLYHREGEDVRRAWRQMADSVRDEDDVDA